MTTQIITLLLSPLHPTCVHGAVCIDCMLTVDSGILSSDASIVITLL